MNLVSASCRDWKHVLCMHCNVYLTLEPSMSHGTLMPCLSLGYGRDRRVGIVSRSVGSDIREGAVILWTRIVLKGRVMVKEVL